MPEAGGKIKDTRKKASSTHKRPCVFVVTRRIKGFVSLVVGKGGVDWSGSAGRLEAAMVGVGDSQWQLF